MRCELERKKQTNDDTMIDMKPADYYLNDIIEYVIDIVWVRSVIVAIKYELRFILSQPVYWTYMF